MINERRVALIINNIKEAIWYAEVELNHIQHTTFKYTGYNQYITDSFLKKFLRKIKVVTQPADEAKKIKEKFYYAYSITGLKNLLKDEWFLEKMFDVIQSSDDEKLHEFKVVQEQ